MHGAIPPFPHRSWQGAELSTERTLPFNIHTHTHIHTYTGSFSDSMPLYSVLAFIHKT